MHDFYNHFNYIRQHVSYRKRVKVAPTQEEHKLINKREPRQVHWKAFVQTKDDMKVRTKKLKLSIWKKPLETTNNLEGYMARRVSRNVSLVKGHKLVVQIWSKTLR